jgi:hypothetical protein
MALFAAAGCVGASNTGTIWNSTALPVTAVGRRKSSWPLDVTTSSRTVAVILPPKAAEASTAREANRRLEEATEPKAKAAPLAPTAANLQAVDSSGARTKAVKAKMATTRSRMLPHHSLPEAFQP